MRRSTDPYGIYVAFSPDGRNWTRYSTERPQIMGQSQSSGIESPYADQVADGLAPLGNSTAWPLPFGAGDVVDIYRDPTLEVYVAQGKTNVVGPDGRTGWKRGVVRSESKDFISWTYPELVISADEQDLANATIELHSAPAFYYERSGHHFATLQKWNASNENTIQIELVVSRDGYRWTRPFRDQYWLPCNSESAFDGSVHEGVRGCCIWSSSTPQLVGQELRLYYGAYSSGLGRSGHGLLPNQTGIGLATIPVDRFAGVRPMQHLHGPGHDSQDSRAEHTFCLAGRPCSTANGSVDRGQWDTVSCSSDSDCSMAKSCNGHKVVCAKGKCGAAACTGSGSGVQPGTVGCGLLCRCTGTSCIGPQNDKPPHPATRIGMVTFRARLIAANVCELLVNADTSHGADSSVSVELLDTMGFRVRGFGADGGVPSENSGHEAVPISGVDTLNTSARWRKTPGAAPHSLKGLPEGKYMVRVYLTGQATLYSLTFSEKCA